MKKDATSTSRTRVELTRVDLTRISDSPARESDDQETRLSSDAARSERTKVFARTKVQCIERTELADGTAIIRDQDVSAPPESTITVESVSGVAVGSIIRDRFELVSVIGEGTTGVVYRALDRLHRELEDRDPYVAIKVLREKFMESPGGLIALQREVRKSQALAHENIISVHSFDRDDSIAYMTMELLDGAPLRELISQSDDGLQPERVIPMVFGMARALAYAHENELVHSDFKPSNVFLTDKGQIKVLDFGVARAVPTDASSHSDRSYLDGAKGMTPAYASPQMLTGEDPTPADDVFSLGIVTFELLTGKHPFDRKSPSADGFRSLRNQGMPAGLSRPQRKALARALSEDRDSRQRHAGEFLAEFGHSRKIRTAALLGSVGIVALGVVAVGALRNDPIQPAVAFEDLPANTQNRIESLLSEGQTALSFGAAGINEALLIYSQVWDMHENNPDAIAGLEEVADRLVTAARTRDLSTQHDIFEALYCQDYLASYEGTVNACSALLGDSECSIIAQTCGQRQLE